MKFILIILGILLLGAFGIWLYATSVAQTIEEPPIGEAPFPDASDDRQYVMQGAQGGSVKTNEFLDDPTVTPDPANDGLYRLGFTARDPDAPYLIMYIEETQFLNIELIREPLGESRKKAEAYLLDTLGIGEEELCALKYMVSVTNRVNQFYASKNLGFSFCQGAVKLPE